MKLTPTTQNVVDELITLQQKLDKSDGAFARDHLSYSSSTWNRIKDGVYWEKVKDAAPVIAQLTRDLKQLRRELSAATRYGAREFFVFDDFDAVGKAITACRLKPVANPDRCVVFLADTGGGKSALCGHAVKQFGAVVVEARESWRRSRFCVLRDLCESAGVTTDKVTTPDRLEDLLVEKLNNRKTVVAIDEAEYFGGEALNTLKLILNKTPTVLLLCAIPLAYDKWNQFWKHEAQQLRRRTHVVIRQGSIEPKESREFLKDAGLNGDLSKAAAHVAKAANKFGRFDMVSRIADELRGEDDPRLDECLAAITRVQKFMNLDKLEGAK